MRFDWPEASKREIVLMFRDMSSSDVSRITPPQMDFDSPAQKRRAPSACL